MTENLIEQVVNQLEFEEQWEDTLMLDRGQLLKRADETDTRLFFVHEGCLRIFIRDDGKSHSIRFGYTGDIIAALDSFITEKPSPLEIQALRRTEVKVISKRRFYPFMQETDVRKQLWNTLLEELVHQQMEREYDLLTSSPAERYERVLKRSPRLFQEVPHKYIASYLRMTPETLSRIQNS